MSDVAAESSSSTAPIETLRPGWREVTVGLVVLALFGFGGGALIARLPINPF